MKFPVWCVGLTALVCASICHQDCRVSAQQFDVSNLVGESKEFLLLQRRERALMSEPPLSYDVQQVVRLDRIPQGANEVQIWISIPSDESNQRLMAFEAESVPGEWKIVEDQDRRGVFLYSKVLAPEASTLEFGVRFKLVRSSVYTQIDPEKVRSLSELERSMLSEHLERNSLHMEVTPKVQKLADDVCGDETNIALQTIAIMKHIAKSVDHYSYSKDPEMPRCGVGDAQHCLAQGGGCCTDLNSLFIALARARGIPARLNMGYRLLEENQGKWIDPGYRCWVEYYVPEYGWTSADVVEADAPSGKGQVQWLTGLTARRVWLNQGRQFRFSGAHAMDPVNHMNIAYAEIDGNPATVIPEGDIPAQLSRKIMFSVTPTEDLEGDRK